MYFTGTLVKKEESSICLHEEGLENSFSFSQLSNESASKCRLRNFVGFHLLVIKSGIFYTVENGEVKTCCSCQSDVFVLSIQNYKFQ